MECKKSKVLKYVPIGVPTGEGGACKIQVLQVVLNPSFILIIYIQLSYILKNK